MCTPVRIGGAFVPEHAHGRSGNPARL